MSSTKIPDSIDSIDTEPPTGSRHGRLFAIILLFILIIIASIFIFIGLKNKSALEGCQNDESPNCYEFSCPSTAGTTATCGAGAYRCSSPGKMQCSNGNSTLEVDILPGDVHLCSNN